jgi:hypothetical protein
MQDAKYSRFVTCRAEADMDEDIIVSAVLRRCRTWLDEVGRALCAVAVLG